ncbi:ATP-binding protein [Methermicoccus shengliensis]|uniref:ATP-binding protein n=1 Tax=Methermicoccus shengliensis TaxID=660064 RepID=A0A832VZS0_9EURY|nr:ATP-binding protein [Methermicoccus shengliensis]HIH69799.1 ATP-binding protein [Methermicoccus shengliensis]
MKRDDVVDYLKEYESFEPELIERQLSVPLESQFVISIIGPRRAGKTYYLFQLSRKIGDHIYLNFEDSRLYGIEYTDLRDIIRIFIEIYGKEPKYLFLDEIQNMKNWEIIIRELHDLKKYRLFLTGSSSKLLSKEIATQLRGRTLSYLLLPFSFKEFLKSKGLMMEKYVSRDESAKIRNYLLEYMEFGGFPDVVLNEEKIKILREYADLILFRDFIERHQIKNIELARFLHTSTIRNFSKEISVNSIFNRLKSMGVRVSKNTVYDYLSKLEDTAFFFFLRKYSEKPHLRESYPKKVYLCDTGLTKIARSSEDKGKLMENVVFLELLRKRNLNPLMDVFYWRDYHQREVDFVVKEGNRVKQLVQVTYELTPENEKREINSLLKASKELGCKNLVVITWDRDEVLEINGKEIKILQLWKWLTEEV